jgi:hypothetical protein
VNILFYILSKWRFSCSLNGHTKFLQIRLTMEPKMVIIFWACYPTCFNDKSFWNPFLEPHKLHTTQRRTLKYPLRTLGVSDPGRGQPSPRNFCPPDFFKPARKQMPIPPENKKRLLLHSWRPLDYKSHIECTSPSRSQNQYIYVHFHLVNKPLSGISLRKWNHQPRTQLTWKSKNYKILINIEVVIFYDLSFEIVFIILKLN